MQSLCTWKMSLLDMSLTTSRHDFHSFCYGMLTRPADVTGQKINRGASYGLEVPCVYRLYGPKVYIQRMNELVAMLDGQKVVINFYYYIPIFLCATHFVGRFLLAAYGHGGAGRCPCPLFGIRRVRFSGVRNVLLLG